MPCNSCWRTLLSVSKRSSWKHSVPVYLVQSFKCCVFIFFSIPQFQEWSAVDSRLRSLGHWDRQVRYMDRPTRSEYRYRLSYHGPHIFRVRWTPKSCLSTVFLWPCTAGRIINSTEGIPSFGLVPWICGHAIAGCCPAAAATGWNCLVGVESDQQLLSSDLSPLTLSQNATLPGAEVTFCTVGTQISICSK